MFSSSIIIPTSKQLVVSLTFRTLTLGNLGIAWKMAVRPLPSDLAASQTLGLVAEGQEQWPGEETDPAADSMDCDSTVQPCSRGALESMQKAHLVGDTHSDSEWVTRWDHSFSGVIFLQWPLAWTAGIALWKFTWLSVKSFSASFPLILNFFVALLYLCDYIRIYLIEPCRSSKQSIDKVWIYVQRPSDEHKENPKFSLLIGEFKVRLIFMTGRHSYGVAAIVKDFLALLTCQSAKLIT